MTEDEKPECRLTYREGKRIQREAERPYLRAVMGIFLFALALTVLAVLLAQFPEFFGTGTPNLDALLADGEISQAVYDYLLEKHESETMNVVASAVLGMMTSSVGFMLVGEEIARDALKKANEEKLDDEE